MGWTFKYVVGHIVLMLIPCFNIKKNTAFSLICPLIDVKIIFLLKHKVS